MDLGLCFSPIRHPELNQAQVYRGRLVIAVRPGHPLLKPRGRQAILGLSKYPAVIHKGQPGVELCEAHPIFERYGITPRISLSFDSDSCAVERVTSSDSWAMVPDLVTRSFSRQIKELHLPSDWDASYFVALVYRADREKNPVVQAVRLGLEKYLPGSTA